MAASSPHASPNKKIEIGKRKFMSCFSSKPTTSTLPNLRKSLKNQTTASLFTEDYLKFNKQKLPPKARALS
jgi:hypothetical protein